MACHNIWETEDGMPNAHLRAFGPGAVHVGRMCCLRRRGKRRHMKNR